MRKKAKQKQLNIKQTDERYSILFWLVMAFMALFLFIAPFKQGLFNGGTVNFEGPIYHAMLWTFIALMILSIYFFFHWRLEDHRDLLSIVIWLIPLSYVFSLFNAVSYHSALNSVYIHTMYAVFFLIGLYFARNELGNKIIQYSILLSGYMLVIFGWMNWFGDASLFGLIQYTDGAGGVSKVYNDAVISYFRRLSNVFQYPNTYAAYLIGMLIICFLFAIKSGKIYITLAHATMIVPIVLSFLLTNSRGALLTLPIVILLVLFLIPLQKQIVFIFHLIVAFIVSLIMMERIDSWVILILVSLVSGGVLTFIQSILLKGTSEKFTNKNILKQNVVVPGVFTLLGATVYFIVRSGKIPFADHLPSRLVRRIQSINLDSASSRTTFFGDSFEIIKDFLLFGAGGGAWSSLYPQYQSYPYTSNQVHNFFLQHTIETGIVGFLILLSLFIYLGWLFVKRLIVKKYTEEHYSSLFFFVIATSILIHSVLDFDMTFVYVGALVFLCLGSMVSNIEFPLLQIKKVNLRWNKVYPVMTFILSIFVISATIQSINANSLYYVARAETATQDFNKITKPLDHALEIKPYHPTYALMKINLLNQLFQQTGDDHFYQEAFSWIERLSNSEPYSRQLVEEEYILHLTNYDLENAVNVISGALEYFPWDITLHERKIFLYFELGILAKERGDLLKMNTYWDEVLETFEQANQMKEMNEATLEFHSTDWDFTKTHDIAISLAHIHMFRENYSEATFLLQDLVSNDLTKESNKELARWYLASLYLQGKEDQELLQVLLEEDSAEKLEIQNIVDTFIYNE